jgi:hypothetical protein
MVLRVIERSRRKLVRITNGNLTGMTNVRNGVIIR